MSATKVVHISEERRVGFDHQCRVVSLSIFKAMCARVSRDERSYSLFSITRSRVWVEYHHDRHDEMMGFAEFPIYYDKETKSVMVVCLVLDVANHGPQEVAIRDFSRLVDCVPLWFDPQTEKYLSTEEQVLLGLSAIPPLRDMGVGYLISFGSHALARLYKTKAVSVDPALSGGNRWVLSYSGMSEDSGKTWTLTTDEELTKEHWTLAYRYVAHEYAKEYDYRNHNYQFNHEDPFGCWGPTDPIL